MKLLSLVLFPLQCLFVCLRPRKQQQRIKPPVAEPSYNPDDQRPLLAASMGIDGSKGLCPPSMCREVSTASSRSMQTESGYIQLNPALMRLRDDLRNAVLECPLDGFQSFIPSSDLDKLVEKDTVRSSLQGGGVVADDQIEQITQYILQRARKLFAILVDRDKACYIGDFMEEGIGDENLPFIRRTSVGGQGLKLETSQQHHIKALEFWDRESLRSFEKEQYRMLAPLLERGAHHEFPEFQTLPYIALSTAHPQEGTVSEGGYSEVFQACIHPDHHNFCKHPSHKGKGLLVAVKRLHSKDESPFTAERNFHQALADSHSHLHVIELLCTYRKGGKFHFVFPWADGSLRAYWRATPEPPFNARRLLWSLKQMVGIASGLSSIHRLRDGIMFGRHGDIKADNIMWFARLQDHDDQDGILQIADMGLARLHRMGSRSNVDPQNVTVPTTYSPPDKFRGIRISRAWDIWSLGCMYLEFVTWILLGNEAIEEFSHLRGDDDCSSEFSSDCSDDDDVNSVLASYCLDDNDDTDGSSSEHSDDDDNVGVFSSDCFYTTDFKDIRPSVLEWVDHLRSQKKCSAVIHDLLDLIMGDMIVLEPQKRISSERVYQKLTAIFKKAQTSYEYLLNSAPVPVDRSLLDE